MGKIDHSFSDQFRDWESMGRGDLSALDDPVMPEPPFLPFPGYFLPRPTAIDDGRRNAGFGSSMRLPIDQPAEPEEVPEEAFWEWFTADGSYQEINATVPSEFDPSAAATQAFFGQLGGFNCPLSFEVIGDADSIHVQFAAHETEATHLINLLRSYFPDAGFETANRTLDHRWNTFPGMETAIVECSLAREFFYPLGTPMVDPMVALTNALEYIGQGGLGLLQTLFLPARQPWGDSILRTQVNQAGEPVFENASELFETARVIATKPLFTAVVRLAARDRSHRQAWATVEAIASALNGLWNPVGNGLAPVRGHGIPKDTHAKDILERRTRRFGMLLSIDDIAKIVRLPSPAVRSEKLSRQFRATRRAPQTACTSVGVALGTNKHRSIEKIVRLTPEHRVRHTHIIGVPGTGKSTLLSNMIRQDIADGCGVAVIDPHDDLIAEIKRSLPSDRMDDLVMLDPENEESQVGLSILAAGSEHERTILASDLVALFERLSTSWGDQMSAILQNAVLALLHCEGGGDLAELRRFLVEKSFRANILKTVPEPEVRYYWEEVFPALKAQQSVGSVVVRLDKFLATRPVRSLLSGKPEVVDFEAVMNGKGILLARLSQGRIGRENTSLLGSLILSKLQQAAIARQRIPPLQRKDFWIYIDEAPTFLSPSIAEIITEARKLRIGLVLAHQELGQLRHRSDVVEAVMGVETRVVFRVNDSDAATLSKGFQHFSSSDLQSQSIGQAICRVGRSDYDFNIDVPYDPDSGQREPTSFAPTPNEDDGESTQKRPFTRPAPHSDRSSTTPPPIPTKTNAPPAEANQETPKTASVPPESPPPIPDRSKKAQPTLGKGKAEHRQLQAEIKALGNAAGYHATIEKPTPDRNGSVDVALESDTETIAVEICVTTGATHEMGNARKCVNAGYAKVYLVTHTPQKIASLRRALSLEPPSVAEKVEVVSTEDFISMLSSERKSEDDSTSGDQNVTRVYSEKEPEEQQRLDEAAYEAIALALKGHR